MTAQALRRGFRGRHGPLDAVLDRGQRIDEEIGSRASAHADDFTIHHVVDGGQRNRFFEFVLCHDK